MTVRCLGEDMNVGGHTLQLFDYTFPVSFSKLDLVHCAFFSVWEVNSRVPVLGLKITLGLKFLAPPKPFHSASPFNFSFCLFFFPLLLVFFFFFFHLLFWNMLRVLLLLSDEHTQNTHTQRKICFIAKLLDKRRRKLSK